MFGHHAQEELPDPFVRDSHGWVIGELIRYEDGNSTYEMYGDSRLRWHDLDQVAEDLGPCDPIDDEIISVALRCNHCGERWISRGIEGEIREDCPSCRSLDTTDSDAWGEALALNSIANTATPSADEDALYAELLDAQALELGWARRAGGAGRHCGECHARWTGAGPVGAVRDDCPMCGSRDTAEGEEVSDAELLAAIRTGCALHRRRGEGTPR